MKPQLIAPPAFTKIPYYLNQVTVPKVNCTDTLYVQTDITRTDNIHRALHELERAVVCPTHQQIQLSSVTSDWLWGLRVLRLSVRHWACAFDSMRWRCAPCVYLSEPHLRTISKTISFHPEAGYFRPDAFITSRRAQLHLQFCLFFLSDLFSVF